jgi:hypothetical protein
MRGVHHRRVTRRELVAAMKRRVDGYFVGLDGVRLRM